MKTYKNEAPRVESAGASGNKFDHPLSKCLSVCNYAEKTPNLQCKICGALLHEAQGKAKLCSACTATSKHIEAGLTEHLSKARRVIRLYRCICCNQCFAPSKFSTFFGICRKCFAERNEPKMRGNFAEQVSRNIRRVLGGVR